MVYGNVGNAAVAPKEVGTLPVESDKLQWSVALEGIEAPPLTWLLCFCGLVVLYEDSVEGVGVLGEVSRKLKVGLDLRWRSFLLFALFGSIV